MHSTICLCGVSSHVSVSGVSIHVSGVSIHVSVSGVSIHVSIWCLQPCVCVKWFTEDIIIPMADDHVTSASGSSGDVQDRSRMFFAFRFYGVAHVW